MDGNSPGISEKHIHKHLNWEQYNTSYDGTWASRLPVGWLTHFGDWRLENHYVCDYRKSYFDQPSLD